MQQRDSSSFLEGQKVRWCLAPGAGIKFHYGDLLVAAQRNIKGFKREDIVTDDITKRFTREHFSETKKERAVTFKQAAKLVCAWFSDPSEAAEQIILFRNLLRTIRSKTKGDDNGAEDEDHIFVHEENETVTKRAYSELTREQIGTIAKNAGMVSDFVEKTQKLLKSVTNKSIDAEVELSAAGANVIHPVQKAAAAKKGGKGHESHCESGGTDVIEGECAQCTDEDEEHDDGGNREVVKHDKLHRVDQIKPLEIVVDENLEVIGRVDVPGYGSRLMTFDIIMVFNKNTPNAAGNWFRELSDDKKKEVWVLIFFFLCLYDTKVRLLFCISLFISQGNLATLVVKHSFTVSCLCAFLIVWYQMHSRQPWWSNTVSQCLAFVLF